MQRWNKATVAVLAGAIGTMVQAIWPELGTEVIAAGTTLLTAVLVYFVPNKEPVEPVDGSQSGV